MAMTDAAGGSSSDAETVTRLLADLERGDSTALEALFPIIYDEMRELAHRQRRHWNGDSTLGTTALVHEAYLKFAGIGHLTAQSRAHFLGVAARAMRQILSNYARDRRAEKRGGDIPHVRLDLSINGALAGLSNEQSTELSGLTDALDRLDTIDPRMSAVVECRFFGGLTIEETASALDISPATVKREWSLARAWLFRELEQGRHE